MAYTDNRVTSATVASVSETAVGTINVSSGNQYLLTSVWSGHANGAGGTCRLTVDTIASANLVYPQNSDQVGFTGPNNPTPINLLVTGPAEIKTYVTCTSATSGLAKVSIGYINQTQGASN
jgi:hypothetical protein